MAPTITTQLGRTVGISHFSWAPAPQPAPAGTTLCTYTYFNLTQEELNCSKVYNCWGFTFIPRRYCISTDSDVDRVLEDNCVPVPDGSVQMGDVIRYRYNGVTTHTGRVWQVDGSGHAVLIRSKWGRLGEYFHTPSNVPGSYGTDMAYFRQQAPLNGVADLFVRDSPGDDGEQFSHAPWWTSPDILVDVPPYDGVPDVNPKFSQANRVWARLANRADIDAQNVYVRYYWADPAAGLPPNAWHLITGTAAHPNPVGPLTVPAHGSIDVPYVEWTPSAAPAHQCLLAIAYFNDDFADSDNPDPIVYPFDIPWENSIGQRNVHVINPGKSGSVHHLSIGIGNPFPLEKSYVGEIHSILTQATDLPILSPGVAQYPPGIRLSLNGRRAVRLKKADDEGKKLCRRLFCRPPMHPSENTLATMNIPRLSFNRDKMHKLDMEITIPDEAKAGSIYYLHIVQTAKNRIAGGYTVVITVGRQ